MKKVLIITYYWPPAGGPGVQRVLKFAKYLPQFGWQPIILTVKNGEYPAIDTTLQKDIPEICKVYKTNSLEPNQLYKKFIGLKKTDKIPTAVITERKPNWKKRVANWVRLNLFIPDAKIGWMPIAVRKGLKIIDELNPDLIFSSSPPPTVHLIAKSLSKKSGLPWIADFRDPWTDIYYYDNIKKSFHARFLERKLEKKVLENCDTVITVSNSLSKLFSAKSDKKIDVKIISNGYDLSDLKASNKGKENNKFIIAYAGKLNEQQNPQNLWEALSNLIKTKKNFAQHFQLLFMGKFSISIYNSIENTSLNSYFSDLGYLDHAAMLDNLKQAAVLLLIIPNTKKNQGILTGKVFEYIGLQKNILGIGPKDGDVAKILQQTGVGQVFDYEDSLEEIIYRNFLNWKNQKQFKNNHAEVEKYDRKVLTKELSRLFDMYMEN